MKEKRILIICLVIVAALLLVNLGVMLSSVAHAIPKTQYKVVVLKVNFMREHPDLLQQTLNEQSTEGWNYVDEVGSALIFKK